MLITPEGWIAIALGVIVVLALLGATACDVYRQRRS